MKEWESAGYKTCCPCTVLPFHTLPPTIPSIYQPPLQLSLVFYFYFFALLYSRLMSNGQKSMCLKQQQNKQHKFTLTFLAWFHFFFFLPEYRRNSSSHTKSEFSTLHKIKTNKHLFISFYVSFFSTFWFRFMFYVHARGRQAK